MSKAGKFAAMLIVAGGLTAVAAAPVRASCGGYSAPPSTNVGFNQRQTESPQERDARIAKQAAAREARRVANATKKAEKERARAEAAAAAAPATAIAANN